MKIQFFTIFFCLPICLLAQTDTSLQSYIYNGLINKKNFYRDEKLNTFDKQSILKSIDYLSNYDSDSVIYNNSEGVANTLFMFLSHRDNEIRKKAFNLYLDFYRLGFVNDIIPIQSLDIDDIIKTKILNLISRKPYNEKEIKVLTTKKYNSYKSYFTDNHLLKFEHIDTTKVSLVSARDSLINKSMQDFSYELNNVKYYGVDMLSELCAWFYIYDAIPFLKEYLNTYDDIVVKIHLARLGEKKYEDEIIAYNLSNKYLSYRELGFINTRKSIKVMIQGLRIEGRERGFITGYNKRGKMVSIECDGAYYKLANLKELITCQCFTIEIPFEGNRYINCEDSTLLPKCEEVAKWMEENIDKLEINPNLRF